MKKNIACNLSIYIGFAGADSDSAKSSFEKNQSKLIRNKFYFLGQNLEYAPVKLFTWQNASTNLPTLLAKKSENNIDKELIECLSKNLEYLNASGATQALWFNELFIDCGNMFIPVVREFIKTNSSPLKIICVVDEPAESVWFLYRSLALVHKIFKGKIKSFDEFFNEFKFNQLKTLNPFLISFKSSILIISKKNSGKTKTLFQVLCAALGVKDKLEEDKISPMTNEELYLRFLFNSNLDGYGYHHFFDEEFNIREAEVSSFNQFVDKHINYSDGNLLKSIDKDIFNTILHNHNQMPLKFRGKKNEAIKLDKDLLLKMLLSCVVNKAKSRNI